MQMRWIGTIAVAAYLVVALASGAIADPVQVSGFYSTEPFGAISSSELTLTFPDFAVNIFDNDFPSTLALIPGFDVGNHSPVSFTQSTGDLLETLRGLARIRHRRGRRDWSAVIRWTDRHGKRP